VSRCPRGDGPGPGPGPAGSSAPAPICPGDRPGCGRRLLRPGRHRPVDRASQCLGRSLGTRNPRRPGAGSPVRARPGGPGVPDLQGGTALRRAERVALRPSRGVELFRRPGGSRSRRPVLVPLAPWSRSGAQGTARESGRTWWSRGSSRSGTGLAPATAQMRLRRSGDSDPVGNGSAPSGRRGAMGGRDAAAAQRTSAIIVSASASNGSSGTGACVGALRCLRTKDPRAIAARTLTRATRKARRYPLSRA
jgi:hypothetical protein